MNGLLAGRGDFDRSLAWLKRLQPEYQAEHIRRATDFANEARYRPELGQLACAGKVAAQAIE